MPPSDPTPYKPVACSFYDVLEAAAFRKHPVILVLEDRSVESVLLDVYAKGTEEFLSAREIASGKPFTLRLDAVRRIIDPTTNTTYAPDHC
ncbi:MAG: hypothetical protein HBSIN02_12840 [Bacteroidia bacterium]|nr:MAG: hypothetical protein HBSIN02_12840 [Bacteroidia bacterium]